MKPQDEPEETRNERARALLARADMRVQVVQREINQGALAGLGSEIGEYAAALVVAALDTYDEHAAAEIERQVRERVAAELREAAHWWAAKAQQTTHAADTERRIATSNVLAEHADRIVRGQP